MPKKPKKAKRTKFKDELAFGPPGLGKTSKTVTWRPGPILEAWGEGRTFGVATSEDARLIDVALFRLTEEVRELRKLLAAYLEGSL